MTWILTMVGEPDVAVICKLCGTPAATAELENDVVFAEVVEHASVEVIEFVPAVLGVPTALTSNWIVTDPVSVAHSTFVNVTAEGQ